MGVAPSTSLADGRAVKVIEVDLPPIVEKAGGTVKAVVAPAEATDGTIEMY